jgi:Secretion system C-terminal sorting domain
MKKLVLFLLATWALTNLSAQNVNFEWAKSMGGSSDNRGNSITVDAAGNVYTTGFFNETVDFDPGSGTYNLSSAGKSDIFVQKLDAAGNFLWAKSMGGGLFENGSSITVDASGNVYITGSFHGTVDFDPGSGTFNLSSVGSFDIFVQKLDAAGNFLWAKSMGRTDFDFGNSITVDASGNVYTTGSFQGTADFDPGSGTYNLSSVGFSDVFVQKLDAAGNFLWAKSVGGSYEDRGHSITVDAAENVYTTGQFWRTVDFDPGSGTYNLSSVGDHDIFVQKLDAAGNFLWAKSTGGSSGDGGNSITVDATGNIYSTGYFQATVDFDPGSGTYNLSSVGSFDIFVQKLDAAGNFLWAKSTGGSSSDGGISITVDAAGNVYTTGYFQATVDFDPGAGTYNLTEVGNADIFVQKLDAAGNFVWAGSMGGSLFEGGSSITIDASGYIYTTGFYQGTADFDPGAGTYNLTSVGSVDIFVQKMSPCYTYGTDVVTACNSYTWIDGITYTISNNTATYTIAGGAANGCDSLVTLDLTINMLDVSVIENGFTLTANQSGAAYQWIDCNNNNNPIPGETNQSFTATADGSYAVKIDNGTCADTSDCYTTTVLGIEDFNTSIAIYPNPANNKITIKGEAINSIKVTDFKGRTVRQLLTSGNQVTIDLSGNAKGVYFVSVETKKGILIKKIVLE